MGQCGGDHGAPQLLSTLVYNGPLLQTVTDGAGRGEGKQIIDLDSYLGTRLMVLP